MKLVFPLMFNKKPMYTAEELTREINRLNGKIQCKISLYGFEQFLNQRPVLESAVINKILIECNIKECKELAEKYKEHSIFYTGNKEFYFIISSDTHTGILKDEAFKVKEEIEKDLGFNANVNYILNKMILMPNTYNIKTETFVIPVYDEELEDLDKIEELALNQRL